MIYILFLSTFLYCIHYSTSLISLLIINPDKLCIKFIENILIFKNRVVLYCIDTHNLFKYSPNDRHLGGFQSFFITNKNEMVLYRSYFKTAHLQLGQIPRGEMCWVKQK